MASITMTMSITLTNASCASASFEHDEREALRVEEQEVNVPLLSILEVSAERVQVGSLDQ